MKIVDSRVALLVACLLLCQSCSSILTDYFEPSVTVTEGVTEIPSEGGDYYFTAVFEPVVTRNQRGVDLKPFRYRVNIGDQLGETYVISELDQIADASQVHFNVPANETARKRVVKVVVSKDRNYESEGVNDWGPWEKVWEGVQAGAVAVVPDDSWESAAQAVSNMRVGWNLGNTLDVNGDWITQWGDGSTEAFETAWGQPVTRPELLQMFADEGFGAIRVPVTWHQHMDPVTYEVDEKWMDRVEEIVNYVLDAGMYCIVNVHHDTGSEAWMYADPSVYAATRDKFISLWGQIAERFRDYDHKLIFEGYNELLDAQGTWNYPSDPSAFRYANAYNQDFVDAVRKSGGNNSFRNLVVTTYCAGTDQRNLDGFVVPEDTASGHLIAQVHSYAPFTFAFEIEDVPEWNMYDTDVFTASAEQEVRGIVRTVAGHFETLGIPWVLGEYGGAFKNNEAELAKQAAAYVSEVAEYGMCAFYWMGLSDGDDRAVPEWTRPLIKDAILQNCRK